MRSDPPGWAWFIRQPYWAKDEATRRHGVLEEVCAKVECGYTWTAAVYTVARARGISSRTIWAWLRIVNGVGHSDRVARLVVLCPRRGMTGIPKRKRRH